MSSQSETRTAARDSWARCITSPPQSPRRAALLITVEADRDYETVSTLITATSEKHKRAM